jgi:hypothetical protein
MKPFDVSAWVRESRARQGLPEAVRDPGAVERVVTLLRRRAPERTTDREEAAATAA